MSEYLDQFLSLTKLDTLDKNENLFFIREKTGINTSVVFLAIIIVLLSGLLVSSATTPFVSAIGCYLIPAYFTFLAL